MEEEKPQNARWISNIEAYTLMSQTHKKRNDNKEYEIDPVINQFLTHFNQFYRHSRSTVSAEIRKDLSKVTKEYEEIPEEICMKMWNLAPVKDDDTMIRLIPELEDYASETVKELIRIVNNR